jgi:FkbM family methyltransferase
MTRIIALIASIFRDGPIIGYGPYIKYRLQPFFGGKEAMPVRVGGKDIWVRPGTPDLRVAFQSLRSELDILSDLLPRDFDGLIVDAGGYIGTTALQLARMYPSSTVVTVEASSQNFAMLERNVAGVPNIVPIQAGLHSESGKSLDLVDRGTGAWGFSIATGSAQAHVGSVETVKTVTLAEVAARFPGKRIGIVKMDIEGAEHAILESRDEALEAAEAVFIELHDRIVPGCSDAFRAFSHDRWLLSTGGEKLLSLSRRAGVAPVSAIQV